MMILQNPHTIFDIMINSILTIQPNIFLTILRKGTMQVSPLAEKTIRY